MVKKDNILDIFIDEGGDVGVSKANSELFIMAFVLHERNNSIIKEENYLNDKLKNLGFKGMIHTMPLVFNKDEYAKYSISTKRNILWSLTNFLNNANIKIKTIVIDKKYISSLTQLEKNIEKELIIFFDENKDYFNKFKVVNIYYDNGQEPLAKIINKIIKSYSNFNKIKKFDQLNNRLFQIADLLTFIEKLFFKVKNKRQLTKAEKYFFSSKKLKEINKIVQIKNYKKNHSKMK